MCQILPSIPAPNKPWELLWVGHVSSSHIWLHGCVTYAVTQGLVLRKAMFGLMLCYCYKILNFRQGAPHFHFALSPANYVVSPAPVGKACIPFPGRLVRVLDTEPSRVSLHSRG